MEEIIVKINQQRQIMRDHGFHDWQFKTVVFLNKDEAVIEPPEKFYGCDIVITDEKTHIVTGIVTE